MAAPAEAPALVEDLIAERRAVRVRVGGEERVIAAEDAGRYRDALGVMAPAGLPDAFLEPVPDALRGLVARYARTRGPFHSHEPAARYDLPVGALEPLLGALETAGTLVRGELRPGGSGREWCDAEVVRRLRRASLAALRKEIEPADPTALGRFLPDWQRIDRPGGARGTDALREVLAGLQGLALPPAQWEAEVLPRRLADYGPARLDELAARGEIVWVGAGAGGVGGGRVAIYFREDAALLGPPPGDPPPEGPLADALREALAARRQLLGRPARGDAGARARRSSPRSGRSSGPARPPTTSGCPCGRRGACRRCSGRAPPGSRRRRIGGARGAPSAVAGRWSLGERLFRDPPPPDERRRARAELLVDRHGVLTRSAVLSEGVPGGYAAVYPALTDLETLGVVPPRLLRRGARGRPVRDARRRRAPARPARRARSTATPTRW